MTDRELLELAAKAAGYDLHIWGAKGSENVAIMNLPNSPRWNPLTDDGDAFRLAAQLRAEIEHNYPMDNHLWISVNTWPHQQVFLEFDTEDQRAEFTRRAIVMVAAKIGETL